MRPLVSVCVVTFNHEKYIGDCIMSVLMQQFDGDLEIIVGEDCSTDATASILAELSARFPARLQVINRGANLGPFKNLKDIVSKARGDFVAHLDGDDYWMPGKLQAQLDFLAANKDCVAVYTNAHVISNEGALKGAFNNPQPVTFGTSYLVRRGNFLNHSSLLYRQDARGAVTNLPGDYVDFRIHLRLSVNGPLGYINRDLVAYRLGASTSMMANMSAKVQSLYWEALADEALDDLSLDDRRQAVALAIARSWVASIGRGRLDGSQLSSARNLGALKGLGTGRIIATALAFSLDMIVWRLRLRLARLLNRNSLIVFYEH